jgi:hypothetical protein
VTAARFKKLERRLRGRDLEKLRFPRGARKRPSRVAPGRWLFSRRRGGGGAGWGRQLGVGSRLVIALGC